MPESRNWKLGFRLGRVTAWEDRLSDIVDYRKVYRHCNVSRSYSENSSWLIGL
jgi:hypothetical protein